MKKFSLFFAALMVSAMTFAAWTDLDASADFTGKKYGNSAYNGSTTYGSWTIVNGANNNKEWTYFKMGGKSATLANANPCYIYSSKKVTESVDSITVHIPAGSLNYSGMSVTSWAVCVYSDSMTTLVDSVLGGTITKNEGSFGFKPSTDVTWKKDYYYKVTWNLANTSAKNGIVLVDKITLHKNVQTTEPTITAGKLDMETYVVGVSTAQNLKVVGENLSDAITYEWENGDVFSATGSLTSTGGTLSINVIATTDTTATDSLILTSGTASTKVAVMANVVVLNGTGTKEDPFSVKDVIKLNNTLKGNYWVNGVILGCAGQKGVLASGDYGATNLLLGETSTDTVGVPVELKSKSAIKDGINLESFPGNVGKTLLVYGSLEAYFGVPGVKSPSDYEISSTPTSLIETTEKASVQKIMENGRVVIIRDGKRYDIVGKEL